MVKTATPAKTTPRKAPVQASTSIWNHVTFTGRLGKDPEMSFTSGGKAVTKFSLAVNQGKTKDAMWLNIVCWEHLAEQVNSETQKGVQVQVRGRLTQSSWKDQQGNKRNKFEVVAEAVDVLESRKERASDDDEEDDDPLGDIDDHPF